LEEAQATTQVQSRSLDDQGQFSLLLERRFAPFFWTQFLGACNDNVFKFAVTLLFTYSWQPAWLSPSTAGLVIGAIFILPFLLFSAISGQLADQSSKAHIMRAVKVLELFVMLIGWLALQYKLPSVLLICIFLMGLHSTLFGPAKYAYLPERLGKKQLMGANALVEAGTFFAILLGNLMGGLLIAHQPSFVLFSHSILGTMTSELLVGYFCVFLAATGLISSLFIPKHVRMHDHLDAQGTSRDSIPYARTEAHASITLNWNPITQTLATLKKSFAQPAIKPALYGISWMWFYGAVFLSLFPSFSKDLLHADSNVASLLLMLFSIGTGIGALFCNLLKHPDYELGLVLLGLIGMSVFTADLALTVHMHVYAGSLFEMHSALVPQQTNITALLSVTEFVSRAGNLRVLFDLTLLATFAGIFSVPLYTYIQKHSVPEQCAQTIAANNIMNALFMIVSAISVGALVSMGLNIAQVFALLALFNTFCMLYLIIGLPNLRVQFTDWVRYCITHFKNPF
jgi:MFS family permease